MKTGTGTVRFLDSEIDILVYWIREREKIRLKKERGDPKPWSDDPMFQQWKFCCIRRVDDRVSQELFRRWYDPDISPQFALTATVLARMVNWPDALFEATEGEPLRPKHMPHLRKRLSARAAQQMKCWTGAYIVPGRPGMSKVDSTMDVVELVNKRAGDLLRSSARETWGQLLQIDLLGRFLAGQCTADLEQLPQAEHWTDRFKFAPVGPGSERGFNRLMGRPKNTPMSQQDFDVYLPQLIERVRPEIADVEGDRPLIYIDWQSSAGCEFDKARRLQNNEGKLRSRYDGVGPQGHTLSLF